MTAPTRAWMHVGFAAVAYAAVLAVSGELHPSSNAFRFFSILWSVQAAGELWQARRRARSAP